MRVRSSKIVTIGVKLSIKSWALDIVPYRGDIASKSYLLLRKNYPVLSQDDQSSVNQLRVTTLYIGWAESRGIGVAVCFSG